MCEDSPVLQRTDTAMLDAEYRQLWFAIKGLTGEDPRYDQMSDRICEIEELREYDRDTLRVLRGKK